MSSLSTNDLHAKEFQTFTLKKLFGSNTYLMKIPGVPTSFRRKNETREMRILISQKNR